MLVNYSHDLVKDVHRCVSLPNDGETSFVRGPYEYWHYGCDGFDDKGWGCGYRTLQTICSWIIDNEKLEKSVPSINTIQKTLVEVEDKDKTFIGSREWIGSIEVSIVLNQLYGVVSKIVHVENGTALRDIIDQIATHFHEFGSPIMMGGNRDCSSKGIVGLHTSANDVYLLIVDPHFVGRAKDAENLRNHSWVKWQHLDYFIDNSFYNICFPQVKSRYLP